MKKELSLQIDENVELNYIVQNCILNQNRFLILFQFRLELRRLNCINEDKWEMLLK